MMWKAWQTVPCLSSGQRRMARVGPTPTWLPACCTFSVSTFVEFCLIQGQRILSKLTDGHIREMRLLRPSAGISTGATAKATFTTSISMRKKRCQVSGKDFYFFLATQWKLVWRDISLWCFPLTNFWICSKYVVGSRCRLLSWWALWPWSWPATFFHRFSLVCRVEKAELSSLCGGPQDHTWDTADLWWVWAVTLTMKTMMKKQIPFP